MVVCRWKRENGLLGGSRRCEEDQGHQRVNTVPYLDCEERMEGWVVDDDLLRLVQLGRAATNATSCGEYSVRPRLPARTQVASACLPACLSACPAVKY